MTSLVEGVINGRRDRGREKFQLVDTSSQDVRKTGKVGETNHEKTYLIVTYNLVAFYAIFLEPEFLL